MSPLASPATVRAANTLCLPGPGQAGGTPVRPLPRTAGAGDGRAGVLRDPKSGRGAPRRIFLANFYFFINEIKALYSGGTPGQKPPHKAKPSEAIKPASGWPTVPDKV